MSNYIGYRCPVCGKAFVQGDDIVVCPDCGTPHHRECYKNLGHCAHEDKHALGEQWSPQEGGPEAAPGSQGPATVECPRCGSHNPAGNIFCQVCGQQLTAGQQTGAADAGQGPEPYYNPYSQNPGSGAPQGGYRRAGEDSQAQPGFGGGPGAAPQGPQSPFFSLSQQLDYNKELVSGVTVREVCDYVGPNNWSFALKFTVMAQTGGSFSVNWCAFFFSFFYCFYRKMYKLGAILLAAVAAAMVPVFWFAYPFFQEIWAEYGTLTVEALTTITSPASQNFAMASLVFRTVLFAISLFSAFFFNKAYFVEVCRNIRSLKENGHFSSGSAEYNYALARKGGVNTNAVLVAVCAIMVLYIGACVWLTYSMI